MKIGTMKYQASHGQAPRGRGLWIFEAQESVWGGTRTQFSHNGTYTEARAAAIVWAKANSYAALTVLP